MAQPTYHFVVNPKSGSAANTRNIRFLRETLISRGARVRIDITKSLAHATELAAAISQTDCQTLVVAGGDGTVSSIAQGMAGSTMPVLILPTGTENLIACELGIDGSHDMILRTLDHGHVRKLDLGLANGRHFVAVAGVGFDGEVIQRINRFRTGHITHSDYIWPICRTFWEYRFPHIKVVADGQTVCDQPALVFVSNISRYAVGLKISPTADFSDSMLNLTIYKCNSRRRLLWHSILTMLGQSHRSANALRFTCRHITITPQDPTVPVELDGEPGPAAPLDIKVIPAAASLLAPPEKDQPNYRPPARFYHLRKWLLR
ncbi:MAG: diacylglycerol kinase family lipid kinase [Sedimentisphaerales bacterium]|nr:diacylglycerol kinase family lipid kinase [Sedimentisphaerales bacterium]